MMDGVVQREQVMGTRTRRPSLVPFSLFNLSPCCVSLMLDIRGG
jgi:hypothetical protein